MKAGWQTKNLGEFIKLEYGKPLPNEKRKAEGKYPVYGANGEKDRTDEFYFDKPSIIVGRKGSAGEINLTEEKFWPLDVTYFVDYDERILNLRFLHNLLQTLDLPKLARGVKPGINRNDVYSISVSIPPLPEQQRIVAILDEAFESIAATVTNTEKNLASARELLRSFISSAHTDGGQGWVAKPISECFKVSSGDFLPAKAMVTSGTVDVYGGNGIAGTHNQNNLSGDNILIGRVGAKCGNVRLVSGDIWLTDNAFYISNYLQDFDLPFLSRLLELKGLRNTANQAAQPVISYTTIKNVMLEFPLSMAEQSILAEKIQAIENEVEGLEATYQQKLTALSELKKSILHKAFSGQLN